ncbi:MAG: ribonuclease R, partial [Methylobacterium sp.]|nr:ribonuclease R [Methylobacterium sp.]
MSTKKKQRGKDPHARREAAKYDSPLPSREYILEMMADEGAPLSVEQLWTLLEIRKAEREIFGRRLAAMERDGQIIRNRKGALCIAEKINLIPGKVQG